MGCACDCHTLVHGNALTRSWPQVMLEGRRIKIDYARDRSAGASKKAPPRFEKPPRCTSVWVGNLPSGTTGEQLSELFRHCGPVKEAQMVLDRRTGERGGSVACVGVFVIIVSATCTRRRL